ncbi:hypothetical protein Pst134EA_007691 [Puccinia striiformis f. sp. tritici]|uniref:hypothetical protein n=1 Tax=Puccinia striiformis f. sp. tritici TaxID=168172 RepID=UPI0020087C87|nr:hypothetical protein Pst134EA_007691 [Puccinia striiformis f. sp. tritici]KAH9460616.1 hypothetical protein Pst134EB_008783 [Puccinia striiformis f. sp. tritici]KAH9470434.1 hypothetical protein Pst134EA_007691 [Puccinia striiformis f. sp. tritici]
MARLHFVRIPGYLPVFQLSNPISTLARIENRPIAHKSSTFSTFQISLARSILISFNHLTLADSDIYTFLNLIYIVYCSKVFFFVSKILYCMQPDSPFVDHSFLTFVFIPLSGLLLFIDKSCFLNIKS